MVRDGVIEGEKVILRPKSISDAANEYAWLTDADLMRLDASPVLAMPLEEFRDRLKAEIENPSSRHRRFAIQTLKGKHIGTCSCYNIDRLKGEAELGILIGDREYLEKGYGTDAVTVLLDYAFNDLGIQRIRLRTLTSNKRAQRVFSKCGFTFRHKFQHRGKEFVSMELIR